MATRARLLVSGWVLAGLFAASSASATSVTWTFDGTLELTSGTPISSTLQGLGVQIGAPVHGFLRFDPSTPNASPNSPNVGQYRGAIDVAAITIGSWSLARSIFVPDPTLTVADWIVTDLGASGAGEFSQVDMLDPTGTYTTQSILSLELQAQDPTLFAGHPLLANPPSLADLLSFGADPTSFYGFGSDVLLIESTTGGPGTTLRIELTSLERVAATPPLPVDLPGGIPEPSLAALALLAALPLALRRL